MVIKRGKVINRILLITLLLWFIQALLKYDLYTLIIILIPFLLIWISPILIIILSEKLPDYQEKKKTIKVLSIIVFVFISVYLIFLKFESSMLWHGIFLILSTGLSLLQVFNVYLNEKNFRLSSVITIILVISYLFIFITISNNNCFHYRLNEDNCSYSITHYIGNDRNVEIPSYYKGLPITKIDDRAFMNNRKINNITFKEDSKIIEIGRDAFASSSLRNIILPKTLQTIESNAFSSCRRLSQIVIPKNVKYVGYMVFSHCNEIKIYCEVDTKPEEWDDNWNKSYNYNIEVEQNTTWNYQGES